MRILAISHLYPHVAERRYGVFVARQLSAMATAGAEITLLVPRPFVPGWLRRLRGMSASRDHHLELVDYPGVDAMPIPYLTLPGIWFWRYAGLAAYRAIRTTAERLHKRDPFDVIYSTQIILSGDAGRRLAKQLQIPSANLAIGTDVNVIAKQSKSMKRHFQNIVSDLDGTLTCGRGLANEIAPMRFEQQLKPLCVYGVVDLEQYVPVLDKRSIRESLGLPTDKIIILYVGYLRHEKGLFELIESVEHVRSSQPNVELVVCGSGVDELAIRSAAKQSPAQDAIRFEGMIDPEVVGRYMQASDLFVLPSYNEGMPNAVMEAMACGLPVVCTSVGGLAAALESSAGATLISPHSISELTNAIREIVVNPERRATMGAAARVTAKEQFDVTKSAKQILEYLSKVVAWKRNGCSLE